MSALLERILAGLMDRYRRRVPDVSKVIELLMSEKLIDSIADLQNDHIAFRTMGVESLGIASLEKIFLHCGYQRQDRYRFEKKKLNAYWYAPPDPKYPRVFLSQLEVDELSKPCQQIIRSYTDQVRADPVDAIDLDDATQVDEYLHSGLWSLPTVGDYEALAAESEYASWVIYNRYYLNHFTISVHSLPAPYHKLETFNQLLESQGVCLNDAGGKIKISRDGLLRQSSTVAHEILAEFSDGHGGVVQKMIPGSYVEFAQRCVLPEFQSLPRNEIRREHRREGFEAANADKIFESTFADQVDRRQDGSPKRS